MSYIKHLINTHLVLHWELNLSKPIISDCCFVITSTPSAPLPLSQSAGSLNLFYTQLSPYSVLAPNSWMGLEKNLPPVLISFSVHYHKCQIVTTQISYHTSHICLFSYSPKLLCHTFTSHFKCSTPTFSYYWIFPSAYEHSLLPPIFKQNNTLPGPHISFCRVSHTSQKASQKFPHISAYLYWPLLGFGYPLPWSCSCQDYHTLPLCQISSYSSM